MTDNCPECAAGPFEPTASRTDDQQLTDRYRCPRCGHTWITRRHAAAYGHGACQTEAQETA